LEEEDAICRYFPLVQCKCKKKISLSNIRGLWCREIHFTDIGEKVLKGERFDKRVWVRQFVKSSSEIQKLHASAKKDSKLSALLKPYLESLERSLVFLSVGKTFLP
jgi:hypothetical protein